MTALRRRTGWDQRLLHAHITVFVCGEGLSLVEISKIYQVFISRNVAVGREVTSYFGQTLPRVYAENRCFWPWVIWALAGAIFTEGLGGEKMSLIAGQAHPRANFTKGFCREKLTQMAGSPGRLPSTIQ